MLASDLSAGFQRNVDIHSDPVNMEMSEVSCDLISGDMEQLTLDLEKERCVSSLQFSLRLCLPTCSFLCLMKVGWVSILAKST